MVDMIQIYWYYMGMIPINPYLYVIFKLMTGRRMSVRNLALRAGLNPSVLYGLYRRNNNPSIKITLRICAALDTKLSAYVKLVEDEQKRRIWPVVMRIRRLICF